MIVRILQIVFFGLFLSFPCLAGQNETVISKLNVQSEMKLDKLLKGQNDEDIHEASGAAYSSDKIFVVFDNYSMVARVNITLDEAKLLGENISDVGYEGITYDKMSDTFYLIEESLNNKGALNARLNIADKDLIIQSRQWLKFNFQGDNKGFEGLTFITKNNKMYVLALCEGNDCESGKVSKMRGAGRIKVFENKKKKWKKIASIRIPQSLSFIDYTGLDINEENKLAITSQESSALWVGTLDIENWQIDEPGIIYYFPKDINGNVIYCNVEGVSWIGINRLVVVSDAKKKKQPKECLAKEQSIHIVSLNFP